MKTVVISPGRLRIFKLVNVVLNITILGYMAWSVRLWGWPDDIRGLHIMLTFAGAGITGLLLNLTDSIHGPRIARIIATTASLFGVMFFNGCILILLTSWLPDLVTMLEGWLILILVVITAVSNFGQLYILLCRD